MSVGIEPAAARPPIVITDRDLERLEQLAAPFLSLGYPVARFLSEELERAVVCSASEVPGDVVTMNSRVIFRIGPDGGRRRRILVYPEDYMANEQHDAHVSVLAPVGAALLGLRVGSFMEYEAFNGRRRFVTVDGLAYQPEAAARQGGRPGKASPSGRARSFRHTDGDDPGPAAA